MLHLLARYVKEAGEPRHGRGWGSYMGGSGHVALGQSVILVQAGLGWVGLSQTVSLPSLYCKSLQSVSPDCAGNGTYSIGTGYEKWTLNHV